LRIKNLGGSDIECSNPYGNQTTHFISCTKGPKANNSFCNYKNATTTFDVGPTICVSSTKEGKTQARWVML
jgi:hypothetical protein